MKTKTIMSTGTREDLVKMINEYYYSKNYIIIEDNRIYNTKTEKFVDDFIVKFYRGRWKVVRNIAE